MNEQYGQLIEPPRVPFAFGAPGWYVLAALLLLAIGCGLVLGLRYYRKNAYRREALKEMKGLEGLYGGGELVYKTNMLVKRIAFSKYVRNETAGIRDVEWIGFLNKSLGKEVFTPADVRLLQSIYDGDQLSPDGFTDKAEEWIRWHKV